VTWAIHIPVRDRDEPLNAGAFSRLADGALAAMGRGVPR
jgi:hypothetical protein